MIKSTVLVEYGNKNTTVYFELSPLRVAVCDLYRLRRPFHFDLIRKLENLPNGKKFG